LQIKPTWWKNAREIFGMYEAIGYRVIYTSTKNEAGLEELRTQLQNKISALAGPSGVGKSSLLNALQPGLGLAVNEISKVMNKGRHTTVIRQMFPFEGGGYVADTPGWKSLALVGYRTRRDRCLFPRTARPRAALSVQRLHASTRTGLCRPGGIERWNDSPRTIRLLCQITIRGKNNDCSYDSCLTIYD
jgi:energy-coupling factor transporter ATP-binding protein EcfA2